MTAENETSGTAGRITGTGQGANITVSNDRVNVEFRVEDLVKQVVPVAGIGHCGGCYGCSGCSH